MGVEKKVLLCSMTSSSNPKPSSASKKARTVRTRMMTTLASTVRAQGHERALTTFPALPPGLRVVGVLGPFCATHGAYGQSLEG